MTVRCLFSAFVYSSLLALAAGCGGAGAEPATPASDAPASEGEPAAEGPKSDEPKADAPAETPKEPEYDSANPKNVLLNEGPVFLLNHRESDIGKKAEEACEKKSKGDVAKKADCLSAAINKMDREGFMFDEDEAGQWWYIRIGIVKGAKVEYNKVMAEAGEPSGKRITIKTSGPDKAARKKGSVPSELQFEVPDEYKVMLQDPDRGLMVFEPKMGLFNE